MTCFHGKTDDGLTLRLVRRHGIARDAALSLPPEGRGMAHALALGEPALADAEWRSANRCRITWRGDGWALSNESATLVCALNGQRVRQGSQRALFVGDTLELGLMHFRIEGPATAANAAEAHVRDPASLAGVRSPAGEPHALLAGLLERSISAEDLPNAWNPGDRAMMATLGERAAGDPLFGLLGELNDEFMRVVRNPHQREGHGAHHDAIPFAVHDTHQGTGHAAGSASGGAAPTLDELSEQASPYPLLRDILQPREGIDQLIRSLDDLESPGLIDIEAPQDVLQLFVRGLPRSARAAVPSLTRRQHHALSPDSPMHLGAPCRVDAKAGQ